MKKFITIMLLLVTTAIFSQTSIGYGIGLLEESNKRGVGYAINASVHQETFKNTGLSAIYTYGVPREGDFQQIQLNAFYKIPLGGALTAKLSGGGALQVQGDIYPTFAFDWLVRTGPSSEIFWSWSPVIRGHFRDVDTGWSHTVTMGINIKLWN